MSGLEFDSTFIGVSWLSSRFTGVEKVCNRLGVSGSSEVEEFRPRVWMTFELLAKKLEALSWLEENSEGMENVSELEFSNLRIVGDDENPEVFWDVDEDETVKLEEWEKLKLSPLSKLEDEIPDDVAESWCNAEFLWFSWLLSVFLFLDRGEAFLDTQHNI